MGSKKAATPAKSAKIPARRLSANSALLGALTDIMRDSLLPGDTPFETDKVREAASFLLDAAARREPDRSALSLASASDDRRFMRIAIINDDMPFLVDSVAATIAAQGLAIDRLLHPVVGAERAKSGELEKISPDKPGNPAPRESMIYIETNRIDAKQRRELERVLRITLADVRAAVTDWSKIRTAMQNDIAMVGETEGAALLGWLDDGMLTQLGHLTRKRDGTQTGKLGICRKSAGEILADQSFDRAFAWFDDNANRGSRVPLIIKANLVGNVHRRVPLDLFIVPLSEGNKVTALSVHAGVWTSAALAAPPAEVPRLRTQMTDLMAQFGFARDGHAGKALVHALTALPHDLLIGFSDEDIARVATAMMGLVDRPRPRLAIVAAPLERHLFAFVWLPRDMLSTQVREQIQSLLEEGAGAQMLDWSLQVEGGNLAMLRFVLDIRTANRPYDEAAMEKRMQTMLRGWAEAVEHELSQFEEAGRAAAIATRYADIFPASYRSEYGPLEAARDISRMRHLLQIDSGEHTAAHNLQRDARLYRMDGDPEGALRLKVYEHEGALPLSDAVPALENFGFEVLSENPTSLDDGKLGTLHDFMLALPEGVKTEPILERADTIEHAIAAVLNHSAEDDPFNRLVIGTGLAAREAEWLRAFYRYLRQAGMGFTIYTVVDALRHAPAVTRALVSRFVAAHDPQFGGDRAAAITEADGAIRTGLSKVAAINDDRLLRLYYALVKAILRTNSFAPAAAEALAFKIQSDLVPGLPKPVPWREIFVYSPRVEGIHLRAGAVARGGLRWSDRRDDFRTEILGLMKAQRVKNAVIVPTGAKGGFYPKQLPSSEKDRDGWAAEGQASYEIFIRTLLSITDNIVEDAVVHPDAVMPLDGEDPYFVVAADKGTAKFSDVANGIAESRDFWLDDAFASGGSNGYDHKAMGITAKGAWVSVQRHFLELGVDVQSDPVSVVGCGDMSGDVFGNGMLLSKSIRILAAFDHRHIFIDPDPDPAASWNERKRLFDLPRSSWDDYDKTLISKGGGVFSRSSKLIKLSAAAQKALGLEAREIEPEALISAIMTAPVDLIWFGGIGTYIKGSKENNIQVGDPANDSLRVDATSLRAKVIGEGANLGVTQAGRIEFAMQGGRINTDFIDNSAGVDCSDNEVNIKIALAAAKRAGKLSEPKRIALLESMTDEVSAIVLENNRLQALALSVAEIGGARAVPAQIHLIDTLEESGNLDRQTEGLADNQTLLRRAADGIGMTRPEMAILLSSAKLVLQDAIENSALPDDATLAGTLLAAFPLPMRKKYSDQIEGHRLRREIIATKLANQIVNRLGMIHPFELAEEEGVELAQVAAAFVAAEHLFNLNELWDRLDHAKMPESARLMLFERLSAAAGNLMSDVLRTSSGQVNPAAIIDELGKGVHILSGSSDQLLAGEARHQSSKLRDSFIASGAPEKLAVEVAHLFDLDGSVGLARLSEDAGIEPKDLTRAFTAVGEKLGIDWAQSIAALMSPSDVWERLLVDGLARDFQQMRLDLLRRLARRKGAKEDMPDAVARWSEDHSPSIRQFRSMITRAQAQAVVAPAMLAQIASQARNLLGR
ncbi:NAD-glutamate dehydrogenase [Pontixanthobacter gangjinensis]|uniref:Glutamate dehydrogenase n=1 Tax=Pontixanthobacter gangjinensis TaxID=1028742 RepID=A0A6I4SJB7_9SPHN|nr:NAD-glutamate dehydrogenase domain-containing protein [Pontixanthobacter gangjinensis]MXO55839.1 glutamate dehydrogenase [Pontixanthobacter gangjinensis]